MLMVHDNLVQYDILIDCSTCSACGCSDSRIFVGRFL